MKEIFRIYKLIIFFVCISVGLSNIVWGQEQMHGTVKQYYPSGSISKISEYRKGLLVRERTYYSNGNVRTDYRYEDGQPVQIRNYYENGQLQSIWLKSKGETRLYHQNGELKRIIESRPTSWAMPDE